jgi:hypothetical protein
MTAKATSRGIGFRSLTEAIDTTTAQGVLVFHRVCVPKLRHGLEKARESRRFR